MKRLSAGDFSCLTSGVVDQWNSLERAGKAPGMEECPRDPPLRPGGTKRPVRWCPHTRGASAVKGGAA